jgi:glycosyltransferase involved in cell wall biosynthesis
MKIYVDPACDIQHTGFYLQGFMGLFGADSVVFDDRHGLSFHHNSDILALVLEGEGGNTTRVILDYGDTPKYWNRLYEWSDVYAKTNIREEDFPSHPKSIPLGRGLPMKSFSTYRTLGLGVSNFLKARHRIKDARRFFSLYRQMAFRSIGRGRFETMGVSEPDYIHFVCSQWKNDDGTNQVRANFMRAAKSIPGVVFDGGFTPRPDGIDMGYGDLITKPFEPFNDYMKKTHRSLTVFNNPSVKGCHSWKLAEFLCWGKAIVSTPLLRMLPAPLVDGVHLLYTDGSQEDMVEKIRLIREDAALRKSLEDNARAYYEEHLLPEKVVSRILQKVGVPLPGSLD